MGSRQGEYPETEPENEYMIQKFPSLKVKVLLGFSLLSLTVLVACFYGAWTFRKLEARMQVVNDLYVPALKALNQLESSFFLLESDLDKSLQEGILRPKDTLESVLNSRVDYLEKIQKETLVRDELLANGVHDLAASLQACEEILQRVYQDWNARASLEADLSQARADFRYKLKGLMREIDRESRLVSVGVQADISRLGIALTLILGFCFMSAFVLAYWLARSLKPIETLAEVMRNISQFGLLENEVQTLANLPNTADEVGTLSKESYRMAASLLDKNKLLEAQKLNLERAHLDLATQNVELRKTQNKLLHSEKLGLVGKLAAQMAHEIRNPLNALNLHAELLEDQLKLDSDALENLVPLRKEINRLISVTESYLDLARAPKIQKNSVQLNEVVDELHDLYAPLFKEKGVFFTCDLGDIPPVNMDKGQVTQVLANLLKNASEAFDETEKPGGKYIRLFTQFHAEKNEVTLSVMDNGAGIQQENQDSIFSPFFTNKAQGTGLGLAYSKQVIEAHGGEILFDSAPNLGSKFTVRMPLYQ